GGRHSRRPGGGLSRAGGDRVGLRAVRALRGGAVSAGAQRGSGADGARLRAGPLPSGLRRLVRGGARGRAGLPWGRARPRAESVDVKPAQAVAIPPAAQVLPSPAETASAEVPLTPRPAAMPRARSMHGDRLIARVLKTGAMLSGGFFLASLALELLPNRESTA